MKQSEQKNNVMLWIAVAAVAVIGAFGVLWYEEALEKEKALAEARMLMTESNRKQKEEDLKTGEVIDQWLKTQFKDAEWLQTVDRVSLDKGHAKVQTKLESNAEGQSRARGAADAVWRWAKENQKKYQICRVTVLANDHSLLYDRRFEMQFKIPEPPMG
ncbi:MAG: hypothetical protein KDA84_30465 [Planctomycetaceae bacterium]|nr:hypothetical protein [Planctomycetaceae bacterium]